ncbi:MULTISPECIES: hypothetical protein [Gallibacterium]|uniref:Uncharacterized protein n=1 Tax=Gallibacterium genomosp. 3 TaxID=505345 RepID=A0A1A7NNS1_9PAST|nr:MULTISPECIES: hypothetical protein [Gallibacterium]MDA3978022.1 hypothetical protein [Gallibacterium sp. AGMB14963]OBW91268.1 hypothetical protein QV01_07955 [Gallibacterium genomosp. 3]
MFVKEHGYDEFVAEKIKEAREDISAGKYITLEQAKTRMRKTIQKTSKDLNSSLNQVVNG